jgi:hypothetical protein
MPNKLLIHLKHLPDNLPESFGANTHGWGKLDLCLLSDNGDEDCLLGVEWHMRHFINWFIDKYYPRVYAIPMEQRIDESVASMVNRFYEQLKETYSYAEQAKFQGFVSSHCIAYGFPSVGAVPHIYVGYEADFGRISIDSEQKIKANLFMGSVRFKEGKWEYAFDIENFLDNAFTEIVNYLQTWEIDDSSETAEEYLQTTMQKINKINQYRHK